MKCQVIRPPSTEACGKDPEYTVVFGDESEAPTCEDCAVYLKQVAESYGTSVKVKKK